MGTIVARSSSVRVIAHSNLSQVPPKLMHVGKWLTALLAAKRSACVAPEVDLGNVHYIHLCKIANKAEPTLALKPGGDIIRNPKQGYAKVGHANVFSNFFLNAQKNTISSTRDPFTVSSLSSLLSAKERYPTKRKLYLVLSQWQKIS